MAKRIKKDSKQTKHGVSKAEKPKATERTTASKTGAARRVGEVSKPKAAKGSASKAAPLVQESEQPMAALAGGAPPEGRAPMMAGAGSSGEGPTEEPPKKKCPSDEPKDCCCTCGESEECGCQCHQDPQGCVGSDCDDGDGGEPCDPNGSSGPIGYFDGSVRIVEQDLSSRGFGQPWGHTRSYSNCVTNNASGVNGNGWFIKQVPYLVFDLSGSVSVVSSINDVIWFDYVGGVYVGRFGIKQTLQLDTANHQFVLTSTRGRKTLFYYGEPGESGLDGKFKGSINPAGYDATTTYDESDRLESFVMSDDGETGAYHYEYYDVGENADLLKSVAYQLNGADVRRANYQYYGSDQTGGNLNDLKTVIIEQFDVLSGQWAELSRRHYRYYKYEEAYGFQYGLKFVVGSEAYSRMLAASLIPETATDVQIAAYADNYFQYDSTKRATLERTHGGAYTYSFDYTESSNPDEYNSWKVKTVETLPDGNQNIVYSNYASQMLLKEFKSGGNSWCEYDRYGVEEYNAGQLILKAEPSAVASYDDAYADLHVQLNETGLIHAYEYYSSTDPGPNGIGSVKGYLKCERIQQAEDDPNAVKLKELKYTAQTVDNSTIYPIWKSIVYQSDDAGGSEPAETTFAYEWYYGSFQIYKRTTTLPAVPTNQNGSGVSATKEEILDDCCGRVLWLKDERGFITHSIYNKASGALVQRVEDVDTSRYSDVPDGWVTPASGGLNLVSDYTFDLQGRTTQELGPLHEVDLSKDRRETTDPTATAIRRARWTVYRDDLDERWEGTGYGVVKALRQVLKPPQTGTALQFDGQQNQVVVPYDAKFFPESALTVECWVKSTTQVSSAMICGPRDENNLGYSMFVFSGGRNTCFAFQNNGSEVIAFNNANVCDGEWHHIAGVWNGSQLVCYVDGTAGTPVTCDHLSSQTNRFFIGNTAAGGAHFDGTVDELRVSQVARYSINFTPQRSFAVDTDTIAYYRFNEGSGDTLHDATENHFDGALTGDPKPAWVTGIASIPGSYLVPDDYDFVLTNPVEITRFDKQGRATDHVQAVRCSGSLRPSESCGALSALDSFPQSSWVRWTKTNYDDHDRLIFQRVYFDIPEFGEGLRDIHYNQSDFGYDVIARQNRVRTPGGTISRTVYHPCDWPSEVWVGTNDTGATDDDPSGNGATGNNMKKVLANVYDGGNAGGNGNLTQQTLYENASTTRVTTFGYDFRNRRIWTDGEVDFYEAKDYDNLDREIQVDRRNTSSGGNLIARSKTLYDILGRVYRTIGYGVNPATGAVGNPLTDNAWYDAAGKVIKQANAGSKAFQKMVYDGIGRVTKRYVAYDLAESSYADAGNVNDDIVMQQVEMTYDAAGNQIAQTTRDRFHDATGNGPLQGPTGDQPRARVSYAAFWPDPLGRQITATNNGTNGAEAWSRPATIPERSDLVLVNTTAYNARGEMSATTDPNGIVTRQEYDDAGRLTVKAENGCSGGLRPPDCSAEASASSNRITAFTYNPDGKLLTLTARNSETGDQVTRFVYGTTLEDSGVASNELLRAKIYPDSDDGDDGVFDRVEYCYNRLGQMTEVRDQNGTIHAYDYDKLGRLLHDRVTLPDESVVDRAVLRISREYEVRGMLSKITSFDSTNLESANVVNEVAMTYNDFAQLVSDAQAHDGVVESGVSPEVSYEYANGSANTIRPTTLAYPSSGRVLAYDYGTTNGMDDVLSRISSIKESTNTRAAYTRLGLGQVVKLGYPEPAVDMTYIAQTGEPVGDAGDPYTGLDRFGRVEDIRWLRNGTHLERVQHGYDRASNKRWRKNLVAASGQDEFYNYDDLYQLTELQRGNLNNNRSTIAGIPSEEEDFTYDPTGNWQNYLTKESGTEELNQSRTHNKANETWQIDGSNATVAYDPAGNMVKMPKVGDWSAAQQLTWDAWNRLVKIVEDNDEIATYAYDGLFRRTTKTASGNTRHFYYSSQWQIVEERLDSSTSADRQFIWGLLGVDDLILRDRFTSGSERLYTIHDTMHVTAVMDNTGAVQERYGYDAFGNTRVLSPNFDLLSSSAFDWETRFCGYRRDSESGLYQARYRYLHPRLGLWLSRDPISDMNNLFLYVSNGPINSLDPTGLLSLGELLAIGGAITRYADSPWAKALGLSGLLISAGQCLAALASLFQGPPECVKSERNLGVWQEKCRQTARTAISNCCTVLGAIVGRATGPAGWILGSAVGAVIGQLAGWVVSDSILDSLFGCGASPTVDPCCDKDPTT